MSKGQKQKGAETTGDPSQPVGNMPTAMLLKLAPDVSDTIERAEALLEGRAPKFKERESCGCW